MKRLIFSLLGALLNRCRRCLCADWGYHGYCIDCWPGYDNCADPRCSHYRCEHDLCFGEAVYVKPGSEDVAAQFDNTSFIGCANAECPCEGFKE